MVNKEQEYVDIEMVKEGHYYIIKLIDSKGTRYSIAMFSNEGEALHAIEIERRVNNPSPKGEGLAKALID